MVEAVGVVEVKDMRVDASGSDSTRVLSDKSDVVNFSEKFFQALHPDVSCHAKL